MSRKSLIWKIPTIVVGVVLGSVLLLLGAVTVVLVTPKARTAVLQRCVTEVNARTDWDVDLGRIYLSPFHQSPKMLYRAFKGEGELPVQIEIDSLFLGHRNRDTLGYIHSLRLQALLEKGENMELLARTIVVDRLSLDRTTFHSDTLIPAVGIDVVLKHLYTKSPELIVAKGQYPLHGLKLSDVNVGVTLRGAAAPKDTLSDTAPLPLCFDVQDGKLSNVHFALNPVGLQIGVDSLFTNVLVDVGGNRYDARQLDVQNLSLDLGTLHLPFDAIKGGALVDLNTNLI